MQKWFRLTSVRLSIRWSNRNTKATMTSLSTICMITPSSPTVKTLRSSSKSRQWKLSTMTWLYNTVNPNMTYSSKLFHNWKIWIRNLPYCTKRTFAVLAIWNYPFLLTRTLILQFVWLTVTWSLMTRKTAYTTTITLLPKVFLKKKTRKTVNLLYLPNWKNW